MAFLEIINQYSAVISLIGLIVNIFLVGSGTFILSRKKEFQHMNILFRIQLRFLGLTLVFGGILNILFVILLFFSGIR